MKGIGVFCGTFNPIHWGHLLMAEVARDQAELEKIIFVTSPNPPHRQNDILNAESRFELVKAACADNELFEASRIELDRSGPSYTVDTLEKLQEEYGSGCRLHLLIGEDNLPYINSWHKAEKLLQLCTLIVAPRIKQTEQTTTLTASAAPDKADIIMLEMPYAPVSGSIIRDRLRRGRSVLYMVPPAVNDLLHQKRFYLE